MNKKKTTISAIVWTAVAVIFSVATRMIDVGVAGETQTKVGCVTINKMFYEIFNTFNPTAYKISEILGLLMILICGILGLTGLIQWIRRKNILKVDAEILCTGVLFSVTIGLYVLFNKVAVTYRPIIVPGEDALEASFPSSHSMLACVVMGASVWIYKKYFLDRQSATGDSSANVNWVVKAIGIIVVLSAVAIPILRMVAGVHWITDIFAGIIMGYALLSWYEVALCTFASETKITTNQPAGKHFKK